MYLDRSVEKKLEKKIASSSVVVVVGPKFCGKTTTALRYAKSSTRLNTSTAIQIASMNPSAVIAGEKLRVIDEWQTVPELWDELREYVDNNPGFGQFLLTGSSTPEDKSKIFHSGAGRIVKLMMRSMSLYESNESKGIVSLGELFNNDITIYDLNKEQTLENIAYLICRGGWPMAVTAPNEVALEVTKNYYSGLFNFEYSDNEKFRNKKPDVMKMVLRSYARNISTEASIQTIRNDVIEKNNRTMDTKTIDDYISALEDLFIIEDIDAWCPKLRSKTTVRSTPTRHFVDTSIATAALGISPADLLNDLESLGLFFEDMAVRDLKIYSDLIDGEVKHYRDSSGLECDAVIHLENGKWGAIEIKLGGEELIEDGAKNLLKLQSNVVGTKPKFLMVLTAVGSAYRREDGVYVVPLNCLKG
jgi:predicted AAA+ superfamily ATPase